jgi:hypothetical protein
MLKQDFHNLIMALPCSHDQWRCVTIVDGIHVSTPGQQQSYSLVVP